MSVVFFGTPAFAVPVLKSLVDAGEDVKAVVTRKDKPTGRKRILTPPPVKTHAMELGIEVMQPGSMKEGSFQDKLRGIAPEFIVTAAYGMILPKAVLDIPAVAPVNVHASILPAWRGASPIAWSIINGDKETGVTTMLMSEGLDEGDILMIERTPIDDSDTTETLTERLSGIGASLIVKTLNGMRDGTVKPVPQGGTPSFAPPLKKEDGLIKWTKTADELFNFARGMYPWPAAYCYINGERLKVIKTAAINGNGRPGRIEKAGNGELVIGTGSGLLSLLIVQPEGRKPMDARSYLQGRTLAEGGLVDGV